MAMAATTRKIVRIFLASPSDLQDERALANATVTTRLEKLLGIIQRTIDAALAFGFIQLPIFTFGRCG
jgi:hypothetical protein